MAGGKPYRWLLDHVYPGLRHTDYVIQYVVRHYPVQQSRRLIYTHPEALSLSEMYRVAESWPEGSDDWLDALLIAARQYPESETANLNAAVAVTIAVPPSPTSAAAKTRPPPIRRSDSSTSISGM